MEKNIYLDMLSTESVSVKTQRTITVEGKTYAVGEPHRRAYINSASGRAELAEELPEPYRSAVMAVWGDTPTIDETKEVQ